MPWNGDPGQPDWIWDGGRPALDFLNTRRQLWRDGGRETLCTPEDLGLWLSRAGALDGTPAVPALLLSEALRLRAAIDEAVRAVVEERRPPASALEVIDARLGGSSSSRPRLVAGLDQPELVDGSPGDPARWALSAIALDAARMLGTAERDRIRICSAGRCAVRFYDRSPAGVRQWCSMRACGNRAKAARHRARRRSR